jgi:hypothetical protein
MSENFKWAIGIAMSLAGILISVLFFYYSKENRSLEYKMIGGDLFNVAGVALKDELSVYHGKNKVDGVSYQLITIINKGRTPIKRNDFDLPIQIIYAEGMKLLSAKIIKSNPANIESNAIINDNIVDIKPTLLNPGDYINIQVISSGCQIEPKIMARIAGIESIQKEDDKNNKRFVILLIISIMLLFFYGYLAMLIRTRNQLSFSVYEMLLIIIPIGFAGIYLSKQCIDLYTNIDFKAKSTIAMLMPVVLIGMFFGYRKRKMSQNQ